MKQSESRWACVVAVSLAALGIAGCAAPPASASVEPGAGEVAAVDPLQRLAVVGASASAGYGAFLPGAPEPVTLAKAMDAAVTDETVRFSTHASAFFFTRPTQLGPELLEEAIASDPTCLVAVDFLFWFCYGFLDAEGGRIDNESERLDLLEIGLGLLDAYGGPIVVGDLPDMSPAVGVMLSLSQLPEPETLKRANERIRAWADRRERVTVYPLSSLVEQVRSGAGVDLAGLVWTPEQARRFIQRDKLHPSVDGQLATAQIVLRLLDDRYEAVRPDDYLQNFDSVRAVLRERAP